MNLFDLSRFDKAQCVLFFIYSTLKQNCDPKPEKVLHISSLLLSFSPSPEVLCCSFQTCRNHCLGKKMQKRNKWTGIRQGLWICRSISNSHNLGHKTTWAEQSHLKGILDFIFLWWIADTLSAPSANGPWRLSSGTPRPSVSNSSRLIPLLQLISKNTFVDCLTGFTEKCMQFVITQASGKWKVQILITHCSC